MKALNVWIVLVAFLLAGCAGTRTGQGQAVEIERLKVLDWDSDSFYSRYGNYFLYEFPQIRFEVVPLKQVYASGSPPEQEQELARLVASEKPDLLFLNRMQYRTLQANGDLFPLKSLLGDRVFESLHKGVFELLKFYGGDELYGVAASMNSSFLFYNRDLFDRYGIRLPDDQMDWEQFAWLAMRFPAGRTLGLYSPSPEPSSFLTNIGVSEGLSYLSPDKSKVTMNTDGWAEFAELLKSLYAGKTVNAWETPYSRENHPFLNGEAAMTFGDYGFYRLLEERNLPFAWGVMPLPGSDRTRSAIDLEQVVSVYKDSEKAETAAKLIEYMTGEKMTRMLERTKASLSASLHASAAADAAHPFHFLYGRNANLGAIASYMNVSEMPDAFNAEFSAFYEDTIRKIVQDQIGVRDGLAEIEKFGNALIANIPEPALDAGVRP